MLLSWSLKTSIISSTPNSSTNTDQNKRNVVS
jgi:hypothetical protein